MKKQGAGGEYWGCGCAGVALMSDGGQDGVLLRGSRWLGGGGH